ncbi:MAG: O-antigen ligase family protein, partial [Clostridium sp.]|nr:O-antigen ligase family protein [Clostridium sp.]
LREKNIAISNEKCALSLTDIGAIVFGVSVLLSYLLSANRQEALWGATGWYMGCITQLSLVGLYFLISRFWKVSPWMIALFLPVSALVFLFGLLNRFGIDPLSMDINNPAYISTIGNINWYCGYLVPIFFACATFIWQRKWGNPLVRILLWIYVGLGFATLVTHGSSSGIVALGVMLVVWYGLSGLPARENDGKQLVAFLKLALFLGGVCLAIWLLRRGLGAQMTYAEMSTDILTYTPLPFILLTVAGFYWFVTHRYVKKGTYARSRFRFLPLFLLGGAGLCVLFVLGAVILNTVRSGSLGALSENQAFVFSPTWGSNRGMTWQAGVELFWQASPVHKIFGVGPDCFAVYLQENGGTELVELVGTVFAGSRLTNAHNEWLTILVNEGIVGLAGFGVMVVSAIWRFVKRGQREKTPTWRAGVLIACGMGILAHSVNGFFSFQQTMSVTSLYLLLGFGEAVYREKVK